MSRREQRWPIWKIALAVAGCGAVCALLLWLSVVATPAETERSQESSTLTVPTFLHMSGVAVGMLTILGVIWLVARIRESRIPVWERKKPRKHRRRRFR